MAGLLAPQQHPALLAWPSYWLPSLRPDPEGCPGEGEAVLVRGPRPFLRARPVCPYLPLCVLSARPCPSCRNLSGNPLECDCGLSWLPRWAEEQQVRVVQPEVATCAGPGPLAGLPLLRVHMSDSGCGECGWGRASSVVLPVGQPC